MPMLKDGEEITIHRTFQAVPISELPTDFTVRDRTLALPLLDAIRNAQRWMDECLSGHEQCQKNTRTKFYPTRLLELGESTMRIVLTAQKKPSHPYATLSYCWGLNPSFLRLTASNLSRFQEEIPCSELPIAFKEAIYFVKSLSIRYIWIDALCILQSGLGAIEDWRSECIKMQDVYSNCIVNLSLSRAAHPNASCFGGCTPEATLPFEVETTGIYGDGDFAKHTCAVVSWEYYQEALYDQPLGFRAWALQERILSPRVLSFGCGQLFWDCVQCPHASESFPCGLANLSQSFCLTEKAIPSTSDSRILNSTWWRLLEEYINCDLTFPETDKLMALSAVATRMASAMDDVYIAGHFWRTLPLSLNWQVKPPLTLEKRHREIPRRINGSTTVEERQRQNQTPSWSWASMHGPVFIPLLIEPSGDFSLADAEAYTVSPVDERNPAGPIASASLTIKAHCAEIEWTREGPHVLCKSRLLVDGLYILEVNADDPDDKPTDGATFWLAALAEDDWLGMWEGLVLEETDYKGERLYRRRGHYRLYDSQMLERRSSWRDDLRIMFGQEKMALTLI
ncbi:HET-domain-containing protein [Viridothelium virens]|uniref:HET-domain-containing protein n=1 Tax=Viridothelium virens TaxID=1048519 RepID=A0A6A6HCK7_VIRVR|nr:HET-domain-containing protein [Viridothelium virens]